MATDIVNKYINSRNPPCLSRKMASRTVEVRAVGAWVHPETSAEPSYANAAISAQLEEERLRQSEYERQEKLKKFQQEVKKRVQKIEAAKRQQQHENSYKAIENERNIIKQSAFAAEKTTSRKNRCTVRANENSLAIRSHSAHKNRGQNAYGTDDEVDKQFEQQTSQVHKYTCAAKNKLMSRRVLIDDYGRDSLPVGTESEHGSDKDFSQERLNNFHEKENEGDEDVSTVKSVQFDTDQLVQEIRRVKSAKSRTGGRRNVSSRSMDSLATSSSVPNIYPGVEDQEEKQQSVQQRALYRRLFMDIEREQVREAQRRKTHQKKMHQLKKDKEEERKRIEVASLKLVEPSESANGHITQESLEKDRLELELHESRTQQRIKIQKDREASRFLEALKQTLREKMSQRNIDLPALCCCGDSIWDTNPDTCANNCVFYRNPKAYAKALQCVLASCDAVFLEALKQTLREKMSQRNIDLPALCCCGDSIWDTNPDTCANNCVFYRNPKAYAKALQCVLASCDAV